MRRLFTLLLFLIATTANADLIKQSATYSRTVLMISSTDHITGKTGLGSALTITESQAGGTFNSVTPTVTELSGGWYKIALVNTDTATLGALNLHVTATGADPTDTADQIVAFDPTSSTNLGLSYLPAAPPTAATIATTIWTDAITGSDFSSGAGLTFKNFLSAAPTSWLDSTSIGSIGTNVMGQVVDGSTTLKQLMELLGAYAVGNVSASSATAGTYYSVGGATARITYTLGANGTRTITVTP